MSESENVDAGIVEKSVAYYAKAAWLRTAVVGISGAMGVAVPVIPAIVGAIDVAITTKAQNFAEQRLNFLCQNWQEKIQKIPQELIDKDFLESEEFFDLVFNTWESTKRTRHREKISLYAKVLVGAVPLQNRREHSPENYLSILAELTPQEIEVLHALYKQQREKPRPDEDAMEWLYRTGTFETKSSDARTSKGKGQWHKILLECPSSTETDIEFVLLRLQRSGLINELSGAYTNYVGGVFVITRTLRNMMQYLERSEIPSPK